MSKTHVTHSGYLKPNKTITPEVLSLRGYSICQKSIFLTDYRGQRSAKDKQRDPEVYVDTRVGSVAQ